MLALTSISSRLYTTKTETDHYISQHQGLQEFNMGTSLEMVGVETQW